VTACVCTILSLSSQFYELRKVIIVVLVLVLVVLQSPVQHKVRINVESLSQLCRRVARTPSRTFINCCAVSRMQQPCGQSRTVVSSRTSTCCGKRQHHTAFGPRGEAECPTAENSASLKAPSQRRGRETFSPNEQPSVPGPTGNWLGPGSASRALLFCSTCCYQSATYLSDPTTTTNGPTDNGKNLPTAYSYLYQGPLLVVW
jgi:hypothetical protein